MPQTLSDDRPLTFEDMAGWFAAGAKPRESFRVGSEHEKFVFRTTDDRPVPYDGPAGIRALMEGLMRFGWTPVTEPGPGPDGGEVLIGLNRGMENISLEPGGQFELSGAPLQTMHDICEETGRHLEEVKTVAAELGLGFLGLGFTPDWRREDIPVMPKGRYRIMRRYMPLVGTKGLDMMFRTCTVQANLDFSSEADMRAKFRVSLALQPVVTALFANSPFVEGKPSGLLSSRAAVWADTDADRTGMLPFVFEDGFGYEAYARYVLSVPMYFVKRDGRYIDVAGRSFADFVAGRLPEVEGEHATLKDWADHASTAFPEVRLKQYLEMRGADGGPTSRLCALPALWAGLLYDDAALAAAWDLVKDWTMEERAQLCRDAPRLALKAKVHGRLVRDIARDVVALAHEGLRRRDRLSGGMVDESSYLGEIEDIAESGITAAERLLDLYHGPWAGDVTHAYQAFAY
ncbi:MAG: glutamate--cysteine ligase [Alphaproteobacteria bacterium]|nr:glutamate--cysteine ligase [Alphaproteobacteria bacterium]